MYEGKAKPGQPDPELVRATADELWKGVKKGWNTNGDNIDFGSMEQRLLIEMRHNVFVTSVFKQHHFAIDMARELFDEQGKIRSFADFKKAVKGKVDPDYNKNWLRTEYNTAYASGQMARKWRGFEKKGGFLVYVAVMDDRTRPDHAGMNGARYPVDHPFWRIHYPPNGWSCRCTVRWDGYDGEAVAPQQLDDIPPAFQNNVGMTGAVFKDSPYFTVSGEFQGQADKLFGFKPPVDPLKYEANLQLFNKLIENKAYKLAYTDNLTGGFVFKHVKTGKGDITENMLTAKTLANRGDAVMIREVVNIHGNVNPDLELNGVLAEVKTNKTASVNAIDNAIRAAKNQAGTVILNVTSDIGPDDLKKAIQNRVRRATAIDSLIVIYDGEVIELDRGKVLAGNFFFKEKGE
jgi:SPP1 gp7 family putative phage head morphogenesis protein